MNLTEMENRKANAPRRQKTFDELWLKAEKAEEETKKSSYRSLRASYLSLRDSQVSLLRSEKSQNSQIGLLLASTQDSLLNPSSPRAQRV